ncbi:MAG TPA: beta-L-arabinofuranosidase domain-containing protein, partial [Gemmatimonadales bacterium]|nr:beta-L-arabinofuranosidase domain-containing protein [Gemmatimonadales bacterium]
EYFGDPDHLARRVDGRVAESCNVYNMLKLTRQLFAVRPDAFYADFHERAQFNHVLSSMDSADGRMSYMVPVGHREQQEYQKPYEDFTCCVGTGMENHGLHGAGIYFDSADKVWVNLYVPSTAQLERAGIAISQDTTFPDGDSATLKITAAKPRALTLAVRRPWWAGDDFAITVNGTALPQPTLASMRAGGAGGNNSAGIELPLPSSSYAEITRVWKNGDTIELALPKTLHLQPAPDDRRVAAIMWGPLVLAGDQGARNEGRPDGAALAGSIPALVAGDRPLTEWIHTTSVPGNFTISQVARLTADPARTVQTSLLPFYRTFEKQYSVYWDVITPTEFDARASAIASERERQLLLDAVTVGQVQPGNNESEKAANYQTDPANRRPTRADGRTGRGGAGWFSYDLPIDAASPTATLVVTYYNGNVVPNTPPTAFDILVEGAVLAHMTPDSVPGFHDVTYALPAQAFQGKSKVTVRFQAGTDGRIAAIYGVRTLRTAQ